MSDRLPQIKPKDLIRILEKLGFAVRRQTGTHCILKNPQNGKTISVPIHSGDLKRGLLFGLLRQAQIGKEEFLKLLR